MRRQIAKKVSAIEEKEYRQQVEKQRLMYIDCRSTPQASALGSLLLRTWRELGLTTFADSVEKYFAPNGEHNQWHHTASGLYGHTPVTQAEERKHREDHRYVRPHANHRQLLTESIPTLLKLDCAHHVGVTRRMSSIPVAMMREAQRFKEDSFLLYRQTDDFAFYYVNSSPGIKRKVTESRVRQYRVCTMDGITTDTTVEAFANTQLSLNEVCIAARTLDELRQDSLPNVSSQMSTHNGDSCDCHEFWATLMCPHLLFCMELEGLINLEDQMKPSHPANKGRGLPQEEK